MHRYIYLHGLGSGPSSKKARLFRDKFREHGVNLEIPDLVPGDFSAMTLTGKLRILDEQVGSGCATLVGSSMGGYVAALFAAAYRERVRRLVLLAPAFGFPARWLERNPREVVEAWRETGFTRVYHHERDREEMLGYQIVPDAEQYPDYPLIEQPTLILHGRNDESVPLAYSETFVGRNPGVRLVALDSDHSLLDVFDRMWEEVSSFLNLS